MRLVDAMIGLAFIGFVPSALAYQETQVSGGGTIKGKVVYNGEIPTRTVVPTKDQQVCGGVREEPEVKVGADNGVGDAIVYLKEVEQGKAWPAAAQAPILDNKDCIFTPPSRRSRPASSTSTTPIRSCTTRTASTAGAPPSTSRCPTRVRPSRSTCRAPGQVRIECDAHGWMLGWVYAVANPYYALTGEDGTFEITEVPPGDYTLIANQAYTGPVEVEVDGHGRGDRRGAGRARRSPEAEADAGSSSIGRNDGRELIRRRGDEHRPSSRRARRQAAGVGGLPEGAARDAPDAVAAGRAGPTTRSASRGGSSSTGRCSAARRPRPRRPAGCRGSTPWTWRTRRKAAPPRRSGSPGSRTRISTPRRSTPASSRRRCARSTTSRRWTRPRTS